LARRKELSRQEFVLTAPDKTEIAVYHWPDSAASTKAVVLILHGMAEHALRYEKFALALNAEGFAVYACDHRGHGRTGLQAGKLGFFAAENGWFTVAADIFNLVTRLKKDYPGLPIFLFGHSMGSYLARTCLAQAGETFAGVILSGTSVEKPFIVNFGLLLSSLLLQFKKSEQESALLDYLTFGSFNKPFQPRRTKFDWLSRNTAAVDAYCADPLCGFMCTLGFFRDLFTGIRFINDETPLSKLPVKPAVLLLGGSRDPVGHMGKDLTPLADSYRRLGFADLSCRLYEEARHELLQEINQEEVIGDISTWLNQQVGKIAS
jgi:alpha-beta hydrolase superfamily lysophospholipase